MDSDLTTSQRAHQTARAVQSTRLTRGAWEILLCVLASAAFLFVGLGQHALWDDEANTALIGEGVWRTGDTSAIVGQNLVAYRGGVELSNLKERYLPPLQYYVVAPFVGLWPGNAFAARLPFAVFGLMSILLLIAWLHRASARPVTRLLTAMALAGNVSFWLYLRQCRYYSLAIFFTLAISYLYTTAKRRPYTFPLLALLSIGLLASNYLNFASLYAALLIDWLVWGRRKFLISRRDGAWLFLPLLVVGGLIVTVWNPLGKNVFGGTGTSATDRLRLFLWAWRDLNRCEFSALIILVTAPIVGLWRRDRLLIRAWLALLTYVVVVVLMTPQDPSLPFNSVLRPIQIFDVRYLAPAIPLMIAVSVLTILRLFSGLTCWPAIFIGLIAFGTNIVRADF